MSRWSRLADTPAYRRRLGEIKANGETCVICGHPGSTSIHHLIPPSRYPWMARELARDPANWAPAHGVEGCPLCPPNRSRDKRRNGQPQRCNQTQGNKLEPARPSPRSRRW
jgi:hypothetical protein